MVSILVNRTYRNLFAAQVLSLIGSGFTTVALGLLAYDLAGADAGQTLGIAFAVKMIAYVGVSPFAGALAGRVPRRAFLMTLDVLRAGMVLLRPFGMLPVANRQRQRAFRTDHAAWCCPRSAIAQPSWCKEDV